MTALKPACVPENTKHAPPGKSLNDTAFPISDKNMGAMAADAHTLCDTAGAGTAIDRVPCNPVIRPLVTRFAYFLFQPLGSGCGEDAFRPGILKKSIKLACSTRARRSRR